MTDVFIRIWNEWKITDLIGIDSNVTVYRAVKTGKDGRLESAIKVIRMPQETDGAELLYHDRLVQSHAVGSVRSPEIDEYIAKIMKAIKTPVRITSSDFRISGTLKIRKPGSISFASAWSFFKWHMKNVKVNTTERFVTYVKILFIRTQMHHENYGSS